jgi:hypothetical protein
MSPHQIRIIAVLLVAVTGVAALEIGPQSSTIRSPEYDIPVDGLHEIESLPGLRGEALPARHRAGCVRAVVQCMRVRLAESALTWVFEGGIAIRC